MIDTSTTKKYNQLVMTNTPQKIFLIVIGLLSMAIGYIGIVVPGLPTTPFLLISAGCFIKSSDRLYKYLTNNRIFGKYIKNFHENKAMTRGSKIFSISLMWIMILISSIFLIKHILIRIAVFAIGIAGTYFMGKIKVL